MTKLCREVWIEVNLDAIKKICEQYAIIYQKRAKLRLS